MLQIQLTKTPEGLHIGIAYMRIAQRVHVLYAASQSAEHVLRIVCQLAKPRIRQGVVVLLERDSRDPILLGHETSVLDDIRVGVGHEDVHIHVKLGKYGLLRVLWSYGECRVGSDDFYEGVRRQRE